MQVSHPTRKYDYSPHPDKCKDRGGHAGPPLHLSEILERKMGFAGSIRSKPGRD
jgi:hypothetical protein